MKIYKKLTKTQFLLFSEKVLFTFSVKNQCELSAEFSNFYFSSFCKCIFFLTAYYNFGRLAFYILVNTTQEDLRLNSSFLSTELPHELVYS